MDAVVELELAATFQRSSWTLSSVVLSCCRSSLVESGGLVELRLFLCCTCGSSWCWCLPCAGMFMDGSNSDVALNVLSNEKAVGFARTAFFLDCALRSQSPCGPLGAVAPAKCVTLATRGALSYKLGIVLAYESQRKGDNNCSVVAAGSILFNTACVPETPANLSPPWHYRNTNGVRSQWSIDHEMPYYEHPLPPLIGNCSCGNPTHPPPPRGTRVDKSNG